MNTQSNYILAVIDPTRTEQWALQKAISIAKNREGSKVYVFLGVYSNATCDDRVQLREAEFRRHQLWLDEILAGLGDVGVPLEAIVEWHQDWREAICETVLETGVNLVVKRASGRPKSLTSSDRQLIRNLHGCALLLVKHEPTAETRTILAAVDFNAQDEGHRALNESIIGLAKRIRGGNEDVELHSVSAYSESDKFVHPPDVAKTLEINRANAHVRQGAAGEVIAQTANKIQADLVLVGNVGRRGLSGITLGNTAEKILAGIGADVLVLMQDVQEQRSAA